MSPNDESDEPKSAGKPEAARKAREGSPAPELQADTDYVGLTVEPATGGA